MTNDTEKLTFMERIVADSRQVVLNHVGGLSTPQQILISLFFFYSLTKYSKIYHEKIRSLLLLRAEYLLTPLNIEVERSERNTNYYVLLDIKYITKRLYGEKGLRRLLSNYDYIDFLAILASQYKVILLPGSGFKAQPWFIRVSLSNLYYRDYGFIAERIKKCIKYMIETPEIQNNKKTKKKINS